MEAKPQLEQPMPQFAPQEPLFSEGIAIESIWFTRERLIGMDAAERLRVKPLSLNWTSTIVPE